jgi:hypothetical protein
MIINGIQWKWEGPFQMGQTMKEPKLVQLDKVYKWFTPMRSEGKPVTGLMAIVKAKCFYDEMKITDMCTLSDG